MDILQLTEAIIKNNDLILSTFKAIVERIEQLESRIADNENALDDIEGSDKLYKAVVELQDEVAKMNPEVLFVHGLW